MITFTVKMRFPQADRAAVAELLRNLAAASRQEPGCVSYLPHTFREEPDTVLIYEAYRDESAVSAHRASNHFKQWAIGGLYQRMLDRSVEYLEPLA